MLVQILQAADIKAGINVQEFHRGNAYEIKGLGRLREPADHNASQNPRKEQREGSWGRRS